MNLLKTEAEKFGLNLSERQLEQFEIYKDYLLEYNSHTNLTSIKEPDDVAIKHFLDSIIICKFMKINENAKVIDVGTGAGFPGVPLKILNPEINLTLVDSLNKRVTFLKNLASKIEISADIIHARAEELAHNENYREKYDFAVSRAVAPLNVLAEYCLGYVKTGGCLVALKGPEISEEVKAANRAISLLGGVLEAEFHCELPLGKGKRSIVVIRKKSETPKKYPRKNSKISSAAL